MTLSVLLLGALWATRSEPGERAPARERPTFLPPELLALAGAEGPAPSAGAAQRRVGPPLRKIARRLAAGEARLRIHTRRLGRGLLGWSEGVEGSESAARQALRAFRADILRTTRKIRRVRTRKRTQVSTRRKAVESLRLTADGLAEFEGALGAADEFTTRQRLEHSAELLRRARRSARPVSGRLGCARLCRGFL